MNISQKAQTQRFKPGEVAPFSGQYALIDASGERTAEERTIVRGEPFPPAPTTGMQYAPSDASKNGAGRK